MGSLISSNESTQLEIVNQKLNYDGSIKEYNNILNTLSESDIKGLGKCYNIWKTGCMYKFLITKLLDNNLEASNIVSEYNKLEHEAIFNNNICQLTTLYKATNFDKYQKFLTPVG